MRKEFNHLIAGEREIIAVKYALGVNPKDIAEEIGKHVSSIYRELKRNKSQKNLYLPIEADKQAKESQQHIKKQ